MQVRCLELRLDATRLDGGAFESLAAELGALGTATETDADSGESVRLAWFDCAGDGAEAACRARVTVALRGAGVAGPVGLALLEDDWAHAWQRDWHAEPVGARLCVRPSFREPLPGRVDVVLDPGMAFGTGQHATTRLCLAAVERVCNAAPPASVLDMGCGSGVLAIAAAKLGARGIVAVDNDPEAVEATRRNAAINDVTVEARLGDRPPAGPFGLVVANILAGPLVDMAPALAASCGGELVLSGVLETQAAWVGDAYAAEGLSHVGRDVEGEWVALHLRRPE